MSQTPFSYSLQQFTSRSHELKNRSPVLPPPFLKQITFSSCVYLFLQFITSPQTPDSSTLSIV